MPSPRSTQRGFTLIELLAVVAVLGMVLFFVIPSLDSISPRAKLRSHARRLASTIELAQGEAAGTGKEFVLAYDLSRNAYWVILPPPDSPAGSDQQQTGTSRPRPSPSPSPGANGETAVQLPTEDVEHGLAPDLSTQQAGTGNKTTTTQKTPTQQQPNYQQRDTLPEEVLPDEVAIQSVSPLNGKEADGGIIYIPFSSLGDEGSHIVTIGLKGANGIGSSSSEPPISIRFNALTRTVDFSNEKLAWQTIGSN